MESRKSLSFCHFLAALSALLAASLLGTARAQLIDLGTLGGTNSAANAVSNGQVVGDANTASGATHAFSWTQAGGMVDLGTLPGGSLSTANAVSNGQVVGSSGTASGAEHAFSWTQAGGMVDLGTLGGTNSFALAISNGQVVGYTNTASGNYHAFSWTQGGGMVDLGTLGGAQSFGNAVSNGVVVGSADGVSFSDAFSWTQGGKLVDLGNLGGSSSTANAVSNGQVVGYSYTATGASHAFTSGQAGGMVDLGTLGGTTSNAVAVSNGQAVGAATTADGNFHAFSWTQAGGMTDLGTLGGTISEALAVDNGQVVGFAYTTSETTHAFSWTQTGGMIDLGTLGGTNGSGVASEAVAVSNGQVVGFAYTATGTEHAFLTGSTGNAITPQENPSPCTNPSEPQIEGCNGTAGDLINTAFGTFSESFNDFSVPGRGLALSFNHTYNSVFAADNGPLGFGWTHSYAMNLVQNPTAGTATISQEDGSQVVFTLSGGVYSAPPRVIATLVQNADGTFTFTRRAQEFFTFSSTGQLMSERDRNGYVTSLKYTGGRLASMMDPADRKLKFSYAGALIASITDPIGRQMKFAYDSAGNLATVTDVNGGQTTFTYSPTHLLLTITDPRGGVITNTYNSSNQVIAQSDPLSRTTNLAYNGNITSISDPQGNVIQEQYQNGERVSLTRGFSTSSAATWNFVYDPVTAAITSTTDPNGHVSTTTYDTSGNPLQSTDGLGRVTTRTWDSMNDLTSVTDPLGVTTSLTYDANGNVLTRSRPLTGTSLVQTFTYQYGDSTHPGDVTGVVDPNGNTWKYVYDRFGNRVKATDPLNHVTKFAYNTIDWLTALTDALKKTTIFTRNSFGDVTLTTDPLGDMVARSYDANRNLTSITDGTGNTTNYVFDAANELTTTRRADGTTLQTVYNGDGTVWKTIDGDGNATAYAYDPLARVISVTDPLGRTTSYTYDGVGNQLTLTDPSSQTTTESYDAADELVAINYSGGVTLLAINQSDAATPNVTLTYDSDGQRTSMIDGTGTSSWIYDSLHRVTSMTNGAGSTVGYSYDLKGQLTGLSYPSSRQNVVRLYDAAGRLTSVSDWLGNTIMFSYDADSNLTVEKFPTKSRLNAAFSYDAADRLVSIVDQNGKKPLASFAYQRNAANLITSATETGVPAAGQNIYTYTSLNQLASANGVPYGYDAADNIIQLVTGATLSYDAANELSFLAQGAIVTNFTYDSRGNRLSETPPSGPSTTYTYDQANRLTAFGSVAAYSYDGDGLRMSKTVGATAEPFAWDRSGALPLLLTDGGTSYVYGSHDLPLEQISSSGTVLFFLQDQLGSTRLLSDVTGTVQASYTYDAYGNIIGLMGTIANPFLYAGQFTDAESGLQYLRSRYYDSSVAAFLTRDPVILLDDSAPPYAYADGSPVNEFDPLGLDAVDNAGQFIEGFGDTFTFGISRFIRNRLGLGNFANPCNGYYKFGNYSGLAASLAAAATVRPLALAGRATAAEEIGVTTERFAHVEAKHIIGRAGKSLFAEGEDVGTLIRNATGVPQVQQVASGNFIRLVDVGQVIGVDQAGQATSIYTVITNGAGKLVTAFPGYPH
jgi:RHS repeat-associated protein